MHLFGSNLLFLPFKSVTSIKTLGLRNISSPSDLDRNLLCFEDKDINRTNGFVIPIGNLLNVFLDTYELEISNWFVLNYNFIIKILNIGHFYCQLLYFNELLEIK